MHDPFSSYAMLEINCSVMRVVLQLASYYKIFLSFFVYI